MRMSYCLASSRDSTITFAGAPCSPERMRRTSTRPMEPVPPVTRTRLPSNMGRLISVVRCRIGDHFFQHRLPGRSNIPCLFRETVHDKAAVAGKLPIGVNFHGIATNFAKEREQVKLADRSAGDLVNTTQRLLGCKDLGHDPRHLNGGEARVDRLGEPADTLVALAQEPFEQAMLGPDQLAPDDGA